MYTLGIKAGGKGREIVGRLQSTDAEHGDDHDALSETHVQPDELGDGHGKDDDVEDDVDDGVAPHECVKVDAFALMFAIPRGPDEGYRDTGEDYDDAEEECESRCYSDETVDYCSEFLARKDSQVQKQKRDFRTADGQEPRDLCQPHVLRSGG